MFKKVLIANRGEIALRVIRACREMNIKTVAVHSTADKDATFVKLADESVCIGPATSFASYLNKSAIISAAVVTNADAVHPGYGFLSENADFAEMLLEHGITFIGPTPEHIRRMGDKVEAKRTAIELGIPVVPGSKGEIKDVKAALKIANEIGYPVIIKAASGGGGRGMKICYDDKQVSEQFPIARAEAKTAFADDRVYMEKYLVNPKHIEIQLLGDKYGHVITIGERDCSMQRKNQKIIEEAPAPTLSREKSMEIQKIVANAMKKLKYEGAGTIEFLYENGEFYFMEMNTRLQVEHPITEQVYGIDLVKEQIKIASGEKLTIEQKDIVPKCHSIECRINAEDPETFVPFPGTIKYYHPAGGIGVRIETGIYTGYKIPSCYDSMIAKLITFAPTRDEAIKKMYYALGETIIDGIKTSIPLQKQLLCEKEFLDGTYPIHWLEDYIKQQQEIKAKRQEEYEKADELLQKQLLPLSMKMLNKSKEMTNNIINISKELGTETLDMLEDASYKISDITKEITETAKNTTLKTAELTKAASMVVLKTSITTMKKAVETTAKAVETTAKLATKKNKKDS